MNKYFKAFFVIAYLPLVMLTLNAPAIDINVTMNRKLLKTLLVSMAGLGISFAGSSIIPKGITSTLCPKSNNEKDQNQSRLKKIQPYLQSLLATGLGALTVISGLLVILNSHYLVDYFEPSVIRSACAVRPIPPQRVDDSSTWFTLW